MRPLGSASSVLRTSARTRPVQFRKETLMYTKRLAASSVLVVVATSGLIVAHWGAVSAAGPTCAVPGDYATIQAAVNDAGCTTINVGSGVYSENLTINRTVVLNGAQAGNGVAGRTFGDGSESTVTGVT